jgi:hypothetical protein
MERMTGTEAGKQEAVVFTGVSRLLFFDYNGDAITLRTNPPHVLTDL